MFGLGDNALHVPVCVIQLYYFSPRLYDSIKYLNGTILMVFLPASNLLNGNCCIEKSSLPVAEQCAWALGNVAGEGKELREILLSQGALPPLARMMLPNKGSTVRTAAWALSNLIKVLNPSLNTRIESC